MSEHIDWKHRWYVDAEYLRRTKVWPERGPLVSGPDYTRRRLRDWLGRDVANLNALTDADWQTAVEALEAHFGIAAGERV